MEKSKEKCGVFGISHARQASYLTFLGLYALQHRGQESCGIVSSDGNTLYLEKHMGYVADAFNQSSFKKLKGRTAIGHVRYSTTGETTFRNAQPIIIDSYLGQIALAHNGNLVNVSQLRKDLVKKGSLFQSSTDSEVILHLIAQSSEKEIELALVNALKKVKGAYSLIILTQDKLIAVRDPYGFRPLSLARMSNSYLISSETCAFDLLDAKYVRDIEPGEILVINQKGIVSSIKLPSKKHQFCIFEHIYFARPDSLLFGENVNQVRIKLGKKLAIEQPAKADIVVPIPDSGLWAGLGYYRQSGLPLEMALIRNHYVGRTFIQPEESIRHFGVRVKLNPIKKLIEGKRVVLVDDSIVRGTTSRRIVRLIRSAGAAEVHYRVSSPPIIGPCLYGIDTPTRKELIAANYSLSEITNFIEADSLGYLSLEGMLKAVKNKDEFCLACFTSKYPVE
ncbi:MAG: amidophosphoribosyltransferase [Candidatus Aminicenantia bacterium]